jgi:hypothetical protein
MAAEREPHQLDQDDDRIIACMHRAPAGEYTPAQLARNTHLRLEDVERRLARLAHVGVIEPSPLTATPAFHLARAEPVQRPPPPTARELAERALERTYARAR